MYGKVVINQSSLLTILNGDYIYFSRHIPSQAYLHAIVLPVTTFKHYF